MRISNGTEGMIMQENRCFHCVNWWERPDEDQEGCIVYDMHFIYNGDQYGNKDIKNILDLFGEGYMDCKMFKKVKESESTTSNL